MPKKVDIDERKKRLKEKYRNFIEIVKTVYNSDNPTYASVAKETGVAYSSVVLFLNDKENYRVVYGIKAKLVYDAIQDKLRIMKEKQQQIKTSIVQENKPKKYATTEEQIISEAKFFLQNDYYLNDASEKLGISKSTLQRHFLKLETIDPELYALVRQKQEKMLLDEELELNSKIIEEANFFLQNNYSINKLVEVLGISRRTIQSHFQKLETIDPELYAILRQKQAKMFDDEENLDDKIIEEAKFYLNHKYTVEEAAEKMGISRSTLQRHFQKLETINPKLYSLVRQKEELNIMSARILGGANGKRRPSYSKEEANKIADILISGEYTLDELSQARGIARTTLYNLLTSDYIDDDKKTLIEAVFQANRHHTTVNALMEEKERHIS